MLKDRECLARYEESMAAHEQAQSKDLMEVGSFPTREQLTTLAKELRKHEETKLQPYHWFAGNVYLRELEIPEDTVCVGKIHKHEHFVILAQGSCRINTDTGMQDIAAPFIWISKPGDQRALVTYEDCVFLTVHANPTDERDMEKLEASIVDYDEALYLEEL
jgi:redox-sensitive bicupin YhaK (pirin superfamily)